MVLFLFAAAAAMLLCLAKVKLFFSAEVIELKCRLNGEVRLMHGALRIPVCAETSITELAAKAVRGERSKGKRRKRLFRLFLEAGKKSGGLRLRQFSCRGAVGNAEDAFLSVMGAGSAQVFLEMLLGAFFPFSEKSVRIMPSFAQSSIWIYMEGIAEMLPLQIIGVMIRRKGD